jgi:hypothetical protein
MVGPLVILLPIPFNYLGFQFFQCTRWRLFKKRVIRTKLIIYVFNITSMTYLYVHITVKGVIASFCFNLHFTPRYGSNITIDGANQTIPPIIIHANWMQCVLYYVLYLYPWNWLLPLCYIFDVDSILLNTFCI